MVYVPVASESEQLCRRNTESAPVGVVMVVKFPKKLAVPVDVPSVPVTAALAERCRPWGEARRLLARVTAEQKRRLRQSRTSTREAYEVRARERTYGLGGSDFARWDGTRSAAKRDQND